MNAVEKSDKEIAAEEVTRTDEYLGDLTPEQWVGIIRWNAEFALLVAANSGREAVNAFLQGLSLGTLDDFMAPEPIQELQY